MSCFVQIKCIKALKIKRDRLNSLHISHPLSPNHGVLAAEMQFILLTSRVQRRTRETLKLERRNDSVVNVSQSFKDFTFIQDLKFLPGSRKRRKKYSSGSKNCQNLDNLQFSGYSQVFLK